MIGEKTEYQYIIDIIKNQLNKIIDSDYDYYSNFSFYITNEKYYVPDEEREPGRIYIVVKFGAAQIDFGQYVFPLSITAVSEMNGVAAVQRILFDFATENNLLITEDKDNSYIVYESFTAPNVISNFEVIYEGYRSIVVMSGAFLLSSSVNRIHLMYFNGNYKYELEENESFNESERLKKSVGLHDEEVNVDLILKNNLIYEWDESEGKYVETSGEEIEILNFSDQFNNSPDPQPYFEKNNFTESIMKYGTYAFTISSYLIDNNICNKVLSVIAQKKNVNNNFFFKVEFGNSGVSMPLMQFKLLHANKTQNKGEIPSIIMAFTL